MLFSSSTYAGRRRLLREKVGSGLILLFGNNDSPVNYPANAYRFRQDSTFLYFFGQHRDGLVGVIDADSGREILVGDEIDIDDIVWYGSVRSVAEMARETGVSETLPMARLADLVDEAVSGGRKVHFLPPYRYDTKLQLLDLLHIHPAEQREAASADLIRAVVDLRSTKSAEEIEELERAATIGYRMHTTAMRLCRPGVTEQYIAGVLDGTEAGEHGTLQPLQIEKFRIGKAVVHFAMYTLKNKGIVYAALPDERRNRRGSHVEHSRAFAICHADILPLPNAVYYTITII